MDTARELASDDPAAMSVPLVYSIRLCNLIMNGLNAFWAYKMVSKLYRILVQGEAQ